MYYIALVDKVSGILYSYSEYFIIPEFPDSIKETYNIVFLDDSLDMSVIYYFKNNKPKQLPQQPTKYHIFNVTLEQWQEPEGYLQTIQTENTTQVNQLSSRKILPKYPIYLQLNLPYDFGQDSVEVQTMRTWIDSVRTLANTAKAEIASATTLEEITTIVDTFKQELAEFS